MKNRVVHFEIQADDLARARTFYSDVFGWEFMEWKGGTAEYWMVMTAPKDDPTPGINGGLLKRFAPVQAGAHPNAFVCTVQVDNYDETAAKVLAAGGIVAMPKFAFPGMAWQGYFMDTENNIFGLHQTDANAK